MLRPQRILLAVFCSLFSAASGQTTFTWIGGADNAFENGANWQGNSAPVSSATGTDLAFGSAAQSTSVRLSAPISVHGIAFSGANSFYLYASPSAPHLGLGAGGISVVVGGEAQVYADIDDGLPVDLLANQTWSVTGSTLHVASEISGAFAISKTGDGSLMLGAASTFSGGLTVADGSLHLYGSSSLQSPGVVQAGPVGTGTLTLGDGVALSPVYNSITLHNAIALGDHVSLGDDTSGHKLTLAGPVTPSATAVTVQLAGMLPVTFSGSLHDAAGGATAYTFTSRGDGFALLSGANDYTGGTLVDSASVVFVNSAALPSGDLAAVNQGYIGAAYDGGAAALLGRIGAPASFGGTLGLDTDPSASAPVTFHDALDFSAFDLAGFAGLGSRSRAVFSGTLTPVGNTAAGDGVYKFGGIGSGRLYVAADLPEPPAHTAGLSVDSPSGSWLTVVLRGANTFTAGLVVHNGGLVIDGASALPASADRNVTLSGATPYFGFTETFGGFADFTAFAHRVTFAPDVEDPILGFDTHNAISAEMGLSVPDTLPRSYAGAIDLAALDHDPTYLGSATKAVLSGTISSSSGPATLRLAGFGTGWIGVSSPLTAANNLDSVIVGSGSSLNHTSSGIVSLLSGASDYAGGTSLFGGYLVAGASSTLAGSTIDSGPLGTGALALPSGGHGGALVAGASDIVLHNDISLGYSGQLQLGVPTTADTSDPASRLQSFAGNNLTLAGAITGETGTYALSGLDVYANSGTVRLEGDNSFKFLRLLSGSLVAATDTSLGTANLTLYPDAHVTFLSTTPQLASLATENAFNATTALVTLADHSTLRLLSPGVTYAGRIEGSGAKLEISGFFNPTGDSTYSGGTHILSGQVAPGSAAPDGTIHALGTGPVVIGGGSLVIFPGLTLPNDVSFDAGGNGVLYGDGKLSGAVNLAFGNILPENNSFGGKLEFSGAVTFGPGGNYHVALGDASDPHHLGTPGIAYDTLAIAGAGSSATFAATLANPFHVTLGYIDNFDPDSAYSWTIASSANGFSGFDAGALRFSAGGSDAGGYTFATSGQNLLLNYTPASVWADGGDQLFSTPANWESGAVPASDGTAWIRFAADRGYGATTILLPATFDASVLAFGGVDDDGAAFDVGSATGTSTLTLRNGTFSSTEDHDGGGVHVTFGADVNLVLAGSQWIDFAQRGSVDIQGNISETGGSRALGLGGNGSTLRLAGHNTFTGGVAIADFNRLDVAADDALGTGPLTLGHYSQLNPEGARTLANSVITAGSQMTIGPAGPDPTASSLTFNGTVTLGQSLTLTAFLDRDIVINGALGENSSAPASLSYENSSFGRLLLAGPATLTGGLRAERGSILFASAASLPASGSLSSGLNGYVGIADPAGLASFLARLDPANFSGTIGFDSLGVTPNNFTGPIDLSAFDSYSGLGTTTAATISGPITLGPGQDYRFRQGGGTLVISSVLADAPSSTTRLWLNDDVAIVLTAANTFSGGATINGGRLVAAHDGALGTGAVSITRGELSVASGVTLTNAIAFNSSYIRESVLSGNGVIASQIALGSGGLVAPGGFNAIGQLSFAAPYQVTFAPLGFYNLDLGDTAAAGTAAQPGTPGLDYDTLAIAGAAVVTSTPGAPFSVEWNEPSGFLTTQSYSWRIASAAGGVTGFDAGRFSLLNLTSGYTLGYSLQSDGTGIFLRYAPPSVWHPTGAPVFAFASAANWDSGAAPANDGSVAAIFTEVGAGAIQLPASVNLTQLLFDSPSTPGLAYSFTGPGTLTLGNGIVANYNYYSVHSKIVFAPDVAISLANSQTFEGPASLDLQGPIGETAPGRSLRIGGDTIALLSGANTYSGGTYADGRLLFASAASVPAQGQIAGSFTGYVGIASPTNFAAGFLQKFDRPNFNGVLGFDTFSNGPANTYADVDLTGFTSFRSVGTTTSAILSGTLTAPSPTSDYHFGGGGGTLTVAADLADGSGARRLHHNSDLTLVLSGNNTFTGGLSLGAFSVTRLAGANALPATGAVELSYASYLGYTEAYTPATPEAFFARLTNYAGPRGAMVGFDSADPSSPRTFSGALNLAAASQFFFGTSTSVILTGPILPQQGNTFYLGAQGDGRLTINSTFGGAGQSLVVGGGWSGRVELNAANAFSSVTVTSGTLVAGHDQALGSGAVVIQGGRFSIGNGVSVANPITFTPYYGSTLLAGNGTFGAPITLENSGGIAPGNSVGTLSFGTTLTWGNGGVYEFEVQDATGAPGAGYDTAVVAGTLVFNASISSPFTIYLKSLTSSGATGNVANFVASTPYSWRLASAGSIAGFDPGGVFVDSSGFGNYTAGGTFSVSATGNNLFLNYAPLAVPEPSTWALLLAGLAAVALAARRRR